ncbi:hypothetical protein I3760_02G038800 [Carya illinoinensis]|uniref:glucose-6-phosphate 1-epimerase n=1 Tax=Carya illinoinensis TaxID=32201 RepID=A0A8T1R897_CARIL|nr:hypothetical protein I3760_02G038800 [Carya illinoinensis]KAG6663630.1 hypothetical protein CIPAW_02G038100 [Carya illinoinensis]
MEHSAAIWDYRAAVEITKDLNGINQVVLRNPQGALVRVSLHGGQVTSWRNKHGEELLFTSSKAMFKAPKAVRGGIPICFPRIIDDNPPLHPNDSHGNSVIDLLLKPTEEDLKFWPHRVSYFEPQSSLVCMVDNILGAFMSSLVVFCLRVSLATNGDLILISRVRNVNGKPFSFSFAYHTYLSVSDISEVRIEGLETLDYLDNLYQRERFTEQGDAITFESEVDQVYLSSPNVIAVLNHEKKRTYVIRKEGLPDVVVWNPWERKSRSMVDFGDEEYKQMLCVDRATRDKPVTLKPGEEWTGRVQLLVVPSSFCSDQLNLQEWF